MVFVRSQEGEYLVMSWHRAMNYRVSHTKRMPFKKLLFAEYIRNNIFQCLVLFLFPPDFLHSSHINGALIFWNTLCNI